MVKIEEKKSASSEIAITTRSQKNMIEVFAERYNINPTELKKVLKCTVMKPGKDHKEITDEELMAFLIVANQYRLNPFTKEIHAYSDTKVGGIIPVVSTDGWNKIMTTHENYKGHSYIQSEKTMTPAGGKACPEWMEIHIQKKDGGEIVLREYLDECFRSSEYSSPWKTHTKRMLRHKTKIQGAREAFGFGGIYDEDEAERIREAQVIPAETEVVRISQSTPTSALAHEQNVTLSSIEKKEQTKEEKEIPLDDNPPKQLQNDVQSINGQIADGRRFAKGCEVIDCEGVIYLTDDVEKARFAHNNKGKNARFDFLPQKEGYSKLIELTLI